MENGGQVKNKKVRLWYIALNVKNIITDTSLKRFVEFCIPNFEYFGGVKKKSTLWLNPATFWSVEFCFSKEKNLTKQK
jgi:hypothetical protein